MIKKNAYLVNSENNRFKILLELTTKNSDGITNYYFELVFKGTYNSNKLENIELIFIKSIDNPIKYIYYNFNKKDIRKNKLSEQITNYIIEQLIKMIIEEDINYFDNLEDLLNIKNYINDINKNNDKSVILYNLDFKPKEKYVFYQDPESGKIKHKIEKKDNDYESDYRNNKTIIKYLINRKKLKK